MRKTKQNEIQIKWCTINADLENIKKLRVSNKNKKISNNY